MLENKENDTTLSEQFQSKNCSNGLVWECLSFNVRPMTNYDIANSKLLQINVRKNRMGNQERTIQRNWQHWTHETQDEDKQKHNTICVGPHWTQRNTNNANTDNRRQRRTEHRSEFYFKCKYIQLVTADEIDITKELINKETEVLSMFLVFISAYINWHNNYYTTPPRKFFVELLL